jgi:sialidase-1
VQDLGRMGERGNTFFSRSTVFFSKLLKPENDNCVMKNLLFHLVLTTYFCLVAASASHSQPVSNPMPQFPGKKTSWKGFVRYDFEFSGRACRVVCPDKPANGNPWIWNARFQDWHTDIVPPDENTFILVERYVKLGGIASIVPCTSGKQELYGHHFEIGTPGLVANFIIQNTRAFRPNLPAGNFHNFRGGLAASKAIFTKEKKGRVAFLGGSITYNHGWRDSVSNYIKKRFPETSFEFINAGIPSFGSLPDAFRVSRDVLSKGRIDLLFVEAAVNDRTNAYPAAEQVRAMEGIVRQAKISNPLTDIVFMYFADPDKMNDYNQGIIPAEIVNHEKVAGYYNLASVNLANEVTERINNREFTWEGDFIDLHPSPFGQLVYYASIADLLKGCWDQGATVTPSMQPLPARLDPLSYEKGRLVEVRKMNEADGWS